MRSPRCSTGPSGKRCRTHFTANLLNRIPRHDQPVVGTLVRTILAQHRPTDAWEQLDRVVAQLSETYPDAAAMLEQAGPDILAYTTYPKATWRRVWSNNPQKRLNRELRRRTDVVGIFPDRPSVIRLVGAVLAEQHDEWQVGRRYMNQSTIREALVTVIDTTATDDEEDPKQLQRVTA